MQFEQEQISVPQAPGAAAVSVAPIATGKKWWQSWWGIIILILLTGPLGAIALYLTWRSKLPSPIKWALTVVIIVVMWYIQVSLFEEQPPQGV